MAVNWITVALEASEQARLDAESARRGIEPGELLAELVRRLPPPDADEQWQQALDGLREHRASLPTLPEETIERAVGHARADLEARAWFDDE